MQSELSHRPHEGSDNSRLGDRDLSLPYFHHFLFMDDYSLSAYMTPTNSSFVATGSEGTAVLSDSTGTLTCTYRIPDNSAIRFRTGNHVIRLIDNISPDAGFVSSSVDSNYVASGSIQTRQRSYVTTQVATTRTSTETNLGCRFLDQRRSRQRINFA